VLSGNESHQTLKPLTTATTNFRNIQLTQSDGIHRALNLVSLSPRVVEPQLHCEETLYRSVCVLRECFGHAELEPYRDIFHIGSWMDCQCRID